VIRATPLYAEINMDVGGSIRHYPVINGAIL